MEYKEVLSFIILQGSFLHLFLYFPRCQRYPLILLTFQYASIILNNQITNLVIVTMIVTGEQNMPIVKVTRNFQVTIPLEVREQLGIEKGDILEAVVQEKAVLFKPKVLFDRESVEANIAEGLEETRAGKTVKPVESREEYDKHVKRTS